MGKKFPPLYHFSVTLGGGGPLGGLLSPLQLSIPATSSDQSGLALGGGAAAELIQLQPMFNPSTAAVYTLQQSNGLPYLKFEVPPGGLNSSAFLTSANGTIVSSYGLSTQGDSSRLVLMSNAEAVGNPPVSDGSQTKNSDLFTNTGDTVGNKLATLTALKQEPAGNGAAGTVQYYSVGGNSTVDLANSLIASILSNQNVTADGTESSRSNGISASNGQGGRQHSDSHQMAPLVSDGHSYMIDNRSVGGNSVINTTMTPLFLSTLESDDLSSPGSSKGNPVSQAVSTSSTTRPTQVAPKKRRPIVSTR